MLQRIWAVTQKELIQNLRDWRTLALQLAMPLIQLLLFGYAIRMNVEHIPTAVADQSLDIASQAFVDDMVTSGYFEPVAYLPDHAAVIQAIDRGQAQAGIVIPPGFATSVRRGSGQVLLLVDGSDLFTSQSAYNAATAIAQQHATQVLMDEIKRAGLDMLFDTLPIDTRVRILYNPDLEDLWFIVPGMLAMLLQVQSITLTAVAIVREREAGTIEQILVTPIRTGELLIGKVVPNLITTLVNLITILGVGLFWFEVPFQGDFWLFLWLAFLYVFSGLGLGLLVSTISRNQRQAQQLIAMFSMVGLVLGGFIFPRYTMPPLIRVVGNLFPLTHFIPISRGIISKGVGIEYLWDQIAALLIYVVAVMLLSARAFRPRLD